MNDKIKISIILGFMCLLLTYGIAIQVKTTNNIGTVSSTNATENKLRDAVLKAKEKYDNLYNDLEEANNKLEEERANSTQNNSELSELESSIQEANKAAGLTEVVGNGLVITLNDNQKISASSYLGDPNELLVHYTDVIRVINELKNAGAQAISVNDQRIISTSSIECVGTVITVNGEKIGMPITIKAIGLQERLINVDRQNGYLMLLRENYGIVADVKKEENITIPKYTGVIKFEYAESK